MIVIRKIKKAHKLAISKRPINKVMKDKVV